MISAVFWDVRAFILPSIIIDNGILEATSIKGWFKLNRPFLFIIMFYQPHERPAQGPADRLG
jgi:hypothetical protein